MYFIARNKNLFKAFVLTRSIFVHTLNFFEQIFADWNTMYEILNVPGDCGFWFKNMYIRLIKKDWDIENSFKLDK